MSSEKVAQAILTVQHVTKSFGAQPILRDLSLAVHEGDRIGLIGANGSGKSTLLKVMSGDEEPDDGLVTRCQSLRVSLLDQQCRLDRASTVGRVLDEAGGAMRELVREYERLGDQLAGGVPERDRAAIETRHTELGHELDITGAWELDQDVKRYASALALPEADRCLDTLSGGELRRVDLAARLIARPNLLLLDEPTNQIDTRSAEWIEGFLEKYAGSCVLVTHDRYFLDRVVTRIVEITGSRVFSFPSHYERFLEYKTQVLEGERRTAAGLQAVLRRELAWLRRGPKARTTKQKARIQRVDKIADAASSGPPAQGDGFRHSGAETPRETHPGSRPHQPGLRRPRALPGLLDHHAAPHARGASWVPTAVARPRCSACLMGMDEPDAGTIVKGDATEFLYVDQTREEIDPEMSILHFVSNGLRHWDVGPRRLYVPAYLEGFLFEPRRRLHAHAEPVGRRTQPHRPRQKAAARRQLPGPRRTHQRPRPGHAAVCSKRPFKRSRDARLL